MKYTIRFYRNMTETINYTTLSQTLNYSIGGIRADNVTKVLTEIYEKGYLIRSVTDQNDD